MPHIYALICPITDDIVYIGYTRGDLKDRLCGHLSTKPKNKDRDDVCGWVNKMRMGGLHKSIKIISLYESNDIIATGNKERSFVIEYAQKHDLLNIMYHPIRHDMYRGGYKSESVRVLLKKKYIAMIISKMSLMGLIVEASGKTAFTTIKRWAEKNDKKLTMLPILEAISKYTGDPISELTETV